MFRAFLFLALSGCTVETYLSPTPVVIVVVEAGDDTDVAASADTDVATGDTDVVDEDACELWDLKSRYPWHPVNPRYSASLPSFEFDTVGVYYPAASHEMAVGSGTFHTADGCGEGYTVPNLYFLLEGVPQDTPASDTMVRFSFEGQPWVEFACDAHQLQGEWKYTCDAFGLGDQFLVTPKDQGVGFDFDITNLPDVPSGNDLRLTMFFQWEDVATGAGTYTFGGGFPAIDSEVMTITPTVSAP